MSLKQKLRRTKLIYPVLNWTRRTGGRLLMCLFHAIYGIDRKTALFSSYSGKGYTDNPRCVCEALHALRPDLRIVWQLRRGLPASDFPDYVQIIPAHSLKALRAYATAGVLIDNMNRPQYMLKFPGQIYVQTWHGDRGFKKILFDMGTHEAFPDGQQMDLAVSGSDFGSRVYRSAFGYSGEILECGCPRNDILIENPPELAGQVRKSLGIAPDTSVLMYAPTFRDASKGGKINAVLSLERVRQTLEKTTGRHWICLSRGHALNHGVSSDAQMDVSRYPNISELLLITDLLISDYSSIAGDFMLLNRPAIFYQPDRDAYVHERALYFDPDESPLMVAHSEDELIDYLSRPIDGAANCREVLNFFGTHESGRASQAVAQRIDELLEASPR